MALSHLTESITEQGLFFPQNFIKHHASFVMADHLAFSRLYHPLNLNLSSCILLTFNLLLSILPFPTTVQAPLHHFSIPRLTESEFTDEQPERDVNLLPQRNIFIPRQCSGKNICFPQNSLC